MPTEEEFKEFVRPNSHHVFLWALAHKHLIHPSIDQSKLRTIADIGTGTGVWLQEVAKESSQNPTDLVGFDISSDQFPASENQTTLRRVRYVTHDIVQRFPAEYYGYFDLVHVRLLTYAIKEFDVQRAVENVVEIISSSLNTLPLSRCIDVHTYPPVRTRRLSTMARMRDHRHLGGSLKRNRQICNPTSV